MPIHASSLNCAWLFSCLPKPEGPPQDDTLSSHAFDCPLIMMGRPVGFKSSLPWKPRWTDLMKLVLTVSLQLASSCAFILRMSTWHFSIVRHATSGDSGELTLLLRRPSHEIHASLYGMIASAPRADATWSHCPAHAVKAGMTACLCRSDRARTSWSGMPLASSSLACTCTQPMSPSTHLQAADGWVCLQVTSARACLSMERGTVPD